MKTKLYFMTVVFLLMILTAQAQKVNDGNQKLLNWLNKKVAPTLQLTVAKDSVIVSYWGHSENHSLKSLYEKNDSNLSVEKRGGRYTGPIYWLYDFEKTTSSSAVFQLDSTGKLQLFISFDGPENVMIRAKQNAFSCDNFPENAYFHQVRWEGEKSLLVDLEPIREKGQLDLKPTDARVKGNFLRMDRFTLDPFFVEELGQRFKIGLKVQPSNIYDSYFFRFDLSALKPVLQVPE